MKSLFSIDAKTLSPARRWAALTVLSVSLFVVMMDMMILLMALPDLIADINPTGSQQLWIIDVYSLILAGLLIPMSALADRWGRKKLLLSGFLLFGVASSLVFFASTASHVIAIRALLGVAGAMIMPTTLSMIRTIFSDAKERATALAIWASVASIGAIAGPVIGGLLLENFSWHSAFLINLPFAIFAVIFGLALLPEARDSNPPKWDIVATILSIGGVSMLVWSIKLFAQNGWTSASAIISLILADLMLSGFVLRSLRQSQPMLDIRLFGRRPLLASAVTVFFSMFAMSGIMMLITQWLQVVMDWSPLKSGLATLPVAIGSLVLTPIAPAISMRFGARTVLTAGLVSAGVGFLYMFAFGNPLTYGALVPALILIGMSTSALAVASAIIMSSTPKEKAGSAAAIEELMYDLGNVFGVAFIGSVAATLYRKYVNISAFSDQGITDQLASQANESVVDTLIVAEEAKIPELAKSALDAFSGSITTTGLICGIILLIVASIVFKLTPKNTNIANQSHD